MEEYIKLELNDKIKFLFESLDKSTILPQLAKDYSKEKHKIDWATAYCQPKLDGMRSLSMSYGTLMSRKGKTIENMEHILKINDVILDGELYVHGESFQTNMSYVKKYKKGLSERIQLWVYDVVNGEGQLDRLKTIKKLSEQFDGSITLVPTYKINSEDDLKAFHSQFLSEGFEGTMVRWGNEKYKINGRSSNLLKYKDFIDSTATIIDIIPAEQRPDWGVPVFDGFKAGVKLSHEERVDLLLNKKEYIGKTAELRYFELTDDGKPRFPIMVGIRLDK